MTVDHLKMLHTAGGKGTCLAPAWAPVGGRLSHGAGQGLCRPALFLLCALGVRWVGGGNPCEVCAVALCAF